MEQRDRDQMLSPEAAAFEREAADHIAALLARKRAAGLRITTVDAHGQVVVENGPAEPEHAIRGHAA